MKSFRYLICEPIHHQYKYAQFNCLNLFLVILLNPTEPRRQVGPSSAAAGPWRAAGAAGSGRRAAGRDDGPAEGLGAAVFERRKA